MRDPNFRKGRLRKHLALAKTRFVNREFSILGRHFKGLKRTCKVLKPNVASNWKEGKRIFMICELSGCLDVFKLDLSFKMRIR